MTTRILLFILFITQTVIGQQSPVELTSSNLPIIIIDTEGQEIPASNPRIIADMNVIFNAEGIRNAITDPPSHYSGKVSIKIRGESSAGWDIKSYSIETQNEDGSNRNVSLLGLPEENDWVLHAPFYDRSLMRNMLSYHISREMGWYASRTVYCEVILNGEYQGVYVLLERIKRDNNRVDIATLSPDEVTGDDVTGGYIIRVDKENWRSGFPSSFPPNDVTNLSVRYQYYYPNAENIVPEQEAHIQQFIHDFEEVMNNGSYSDPDSGYARYLSVDSFVDYVILNELSRNVDGYRLSTYFTKQKDSNGGKLLAGPVWDYNFSFGNVEYYNAGRIDGWQILFFADNERFQQIDPAQSPFWWKVLFNDRKFRKKLIDRWSELRETTLSIDYLYSMMDNYAKITEEARVRNFQVRPKPGSNELGGGWHPPDPRSNQITTYEDELNLTKNWIADRISWIDTNIQLLVANESTERSTTFTLYQNYPNPFNPTTTINFEIPATSFVRLNIYNLKGQLVQKLINKTLTSGAHQAEFNATDLSSGVYFYSIETVSFRQTRKMMLIK